MESKKSADVDAVQDAINAALAIRASLDTKRQEVLDAAGILAQKMAQQSQLEVDLGSALDTINDEYNH